MNNLFGGLSAIVMAIIGLAILAVILSPKSQAANVIHASGSFLSNLIASAVKPVA